ncbi:MAG: TetR/AcrR family transcriptional regulator [Proteobacteria bacterium]|nr:MAG: TetR/AcrR family transcriptional regulator [Pseudomonadota bacterium]
MSENAREKIMKAAKELAQTRGYAGLNFRDIAETVGIKSASVYHHFASKSELGVAVARRYWEDTQALLDSIASKTKEPVRSLRRYPEVFRTTLENGNRMCLCSFMSAEYDELPPEVRKEVQTFTDVNVKWIAKQLVEAKLEKEKKSHQRASAIFAAISGAQLVARSRSDLKLFDSLVVGYRDAGLLP